jgi:O-antigen/teichoic acid export membrane protein
MYVKPYNFNYKDWKGYWLYHLKEGKWLLMSALVQWGASNLFVVASGVYLGVQALGALRLVQSLFGLLNILLQVFENYIIPQTAYYLSKSTTHAIGYLAHTNKQAFYWFGFILLLFTFFSEQIIVMAGGVQYAEYAFLMNGMVILYILIFINQPIRIAIRVLILNQYFFYGYLISLAFTLISFDFMLSNWGLMGVLLGLISSQIILILFWQNILLTKKFAIWKSFI